MVRTCRLPDSTGEPFQLLRETFPKSRAEGTAGSHKTGRFGDDITRLTALERRNANDGSIKGLGFPAHQGLDSIIVGNTSRYRVYGFFRMGPMTTPAFDENIEGIGRRMMVFLKIAIP